MSKIYQSITIEEIQKVAYQGYYWLSDAEYPVMVEPDQPLDYTVFDLPRDPFVVEANLYNATEKVSISIRYLDGAYQVIRFNLADANYKPQEYLAHDVNYKKYIMAEGWEQVKEKSFSAVLGQEVKVWEPTWEAFIGFKIKK